MLPEHLKSQLFSEPKTAEKPTPRPSIADLIHANQVQAMVARTTAAQFAHTHGLNLIDFHVVQSVISLDDNDSTATPGYIARELSLSASTLTSILERLVRGGYLIRERDSADRRRISIYHTDKSAQLVADYYLHLAEQYEKTFADTNDAEINNQIRFVSTLTEANIRVVRKFEKSGENLRSATQGRAAIADQSAASRPAPGGNSEQAAS